MEKLYSFRRSKRIKYIDAHEEALKLKETVVQKLSDNKKLVAFPIYG